MRILRNRFFIFIIIFGSLTILSFGFEVLPENPKLSMWTVGDGIKTRFGSNFYKVMSHLNEEKEQLDNLLLAIAEQPLTEKQIMKKARLSQSQTSHLISKLDSINLIKKDTQGRWETTVPVITDSQMKVIRKDLIPMAESTAQYLKKEAGQLKTLYEQSKSPLDPSWDDVIHLLFDKFIVDGTFHSAINKLKAKWKAGNSEISEYPGTPLFFLEQGPNFATLGSNWYPFNENEDQREVYVLHGGVYNRYSIPMESYRRDHSFSKAFFKITPEGGINNLSDEGKEMFGSLGWIEDNKLLIPIVKAETVKSLWPIIKQMGSEAAEAAFAHFEDILKSFNKSPHSKFLEEKEDYIQVCIHVLFGLAVELLEENGVVTDIPEPLPDHFVVYFVFGKLF